MNTWNCKNCNEEIEEQFDSCWSCGFTKSGNKSSEHISQNRKTLESQSIKTSTWGGACIALSALIFLYLTFFGTDLKSIEDLRSIRNLSIFSFILLFMGGVFIYIDKD